MNYMSTMSRHPTFTEYEDVKYIFRTASNEVRVNVLSAVNVKGKVHYKDTELPTIKLN